MADHNAHDTPLKSTVLHALHLARGGKMVPFAGYDMPVQYADGVLREHLWTREHAGLFDVSHMGQAVLTGPDHETAALALEALTPGNIVGLAPGRMRYTLLMNAAGGIIDDLIVTRPADPADDGKLMIVWNASRKDVDTAHVRAHLPQGITLETIEDRALIALQGPEAEAVLAQHAGFVAGLSFMSAAKGDVAGTACDVSRSGYTGEDGFEISVPLDRAVALAERLLSDERVKPIGLGARDSLRLEAGLCLYGSDLDETTSPVEGDLKFAISKVRRAGGARAGGFAGADRVMKELADGCARYRVGLAGLSRAPIRAGTKLYPDETGQTPIGEVTSGGFGPSANKPVAMGYVSAGYEATGQRVFADVRGKRLEVDVAEMPFVAHRYKR